jgi:hypothetical protein
MIRSYHSYDNNHCPSDAIHSFLQEPQIVVRTPPCRLDANKVENTLDSLQKLNLKRVGFATAENIEYPQEPCQLHNDQLEAAVAARWYTSAELANFVKYHHGIALKARSFDQQKIQYYCRGLEDLLSIRAGIEARARKVQYVQAVLDEQQRAKTFRTETNNDKAEKVRAKARAASKLGRLLARQRAKLDAQDVKKQNMDAVNAQTTTTTTTTPTTAIPFRRCFTLRGSPTPTTTTGNESQMRAHYYYCNPMGRKEWKVSDSPNAPTSREAVTAYDAFRKDSIQTTVL